MKSFFALLFLLTLIPDCFAQNAEIEKRMKDSSERYNECVYFSAISRLKKTGGDDINQAAEGAFSSCSSEASFMNNLMLEAGFTTPQINAVFLDKNTGIKRELRKMLHEAQGIK